MSSSGLARRTEIRLKIAGTDVSGDINKYLISCVYTDYEEDHADDLSITLDDRENIWLKSWLNSSPEVAPASEKAVIKVGERVFVKNGAADYNGTALHTWVYSYEPGFTVLEISKTRPDRIVIGINGQVTAAMRAEDLIYKDSGEAASAGVPASKGLEISAVIAQLNFRSDGKDKLLDCGSFEIDSIIANGPPQTITLKGTSLPYTSTMRNQTKSRAWEKISLSKIAKEIARKNGLDCMFLSAYDPFYKRREQIRQSDITFLQSLAKNAGISLKVTAKSLVLFDEADYEGKKTIAAFVRGTSDVKTYSFSSKLNDTSYSSCHVSYTNPETGEAIEYTYTPRDNSGSGQTLEINEKVDTREEARQLAMKRLRQKNKKENTARFTMTGNTELVAGANVSLEGYGLFDGKYIIESATHNITGSGYTTEIECRKTLEGY